MATLEEVRYRLHALSNPEKARILQRFFKTGPGEYGEGDRFLGIRVPEVRKVAREFRGLPRRVVVELLRSEYHEERHLALLLLVDRYARRDAAAQEEIYDLYLAHTPYINNWDLVDVSAEHIVGAHLWDRDRDPLRVLARSDLLWERRIAILATFHFIRRREYVTALEIAALLLRDPHDLIHKAVGWMLREVGKRDQAVAEHFLTGHYRDMPRTMLRYAIERYPEPLRQQYLRRNS
jgi:3-methyladenine DNA glycosylase AlkD